MARARRGSAEWKDNVARGRRYGVDVRRRTQTIRPMHVDRWIADGLVAPQLAPIVKARAAQVADIVADLGGETECSAAERAVLDGWFKSAVCADGLFQRFVMSGDPDALERM